VCKGISTSENAFRGRLSEGSSSDCQATTEIMMIIQGKQSCRTLGGWSGYAVENVMSREKTPPAYGEPAGPMMVATHSKMLSRLGPAEMPVGGSRVISASSF